MSICSFWNIANLHGTPVFEKVEALLLVEWNIFGLIRHNFDIEVILVFLLYHVNHVAGNAMSVIFGINQYIMDKSNHLGVINSTRKSDEPVVVPCRDDCLGIEERLVKTFWIAP